ncbi:MAG: hypothetical protein R2747_17300 [Pyrinomonadaceae bacterium]
MDPALSRRFFIRTPKLPVLGSNIFPLTGFPSNTPGLISIVSVRLILLFLSQKDQTFIEKPFARGFRLHFSENMPSRIADMMKVLGLQYFADPGSSFDKLNL